MVGHIQKIREREIDSYFFNVCRELMDTQLTGHYLEYIKGCNCSRCIAYRVYEKVKRRS